MFTDGVGEGCLILMDVARKSVDVFQYYRVYKDHEVDMLGSFQ